MDTKTYNNQFDEVYPEEILRKRFAENVNQWIVTTRKLQKLQEEQIQIAQLIHLDREEARMNGIELD